MISLTAKLVAAYLKNNSLAASNLPELIRSTYEALVGTAKPTILPVEPQQPALSIKKSVTPEAIFCLECGKSQKILKRHLETAHGLSVEDYRAKWSLPADYPMVAAAYAQRRSELAVQFGLGRKGAVSGNEQPEQPHQDDEALSGNKPFHQYPASRWSRPAG